ncbi:hypothetical protein [Streptodolium elevatio]|uniref:Uncharacterized protein n=1 Tax=Streptodolium elevatio TaxID=3157996 RepID=A0ABV3DDK2_9ACTN
MQKVGVLGREGVLVSGRSLPRRGVAAARSGAPLSPAGSRPVAVEVVLLRALPQLGYRVVRGAPLPAEAPDAAAVRLAGLPRKAARRADLVVHSTSWRYDDAGQVVLMYAVAPDPFPQLPAVAVDLGAVARGTGPARPSPTRVRVGDVAAHAVRHLAFLARCDAQVRSALEGIADRGD